MRVASGNFEQIRPGLAPAKFLAGFAGFFAAALSLNFVCCR